MIQSAKKRGGWGRAWPHLTWQCQATLRPGDAPVRRASISAPEGRRSLAVGVSPRKANYQHFFNRVAAVEAHTMALRRRCAACDDCDTETKEFQGAVFSVAASGVNPAVLILLEPLASDGESVWHYGVARMTSCGVTLKYHDKVVWQVEAHRAPPRDFPTWTFFYTPCGEFDHDGADDSTAGGNQTNKGGAK